MRRDNEVRWRVTFVAIFVACVVMGSTTWATLVQFVPITSSVSGPPYPTDPLITDILVEESNGPVTINQLASSISNTTPTAKYQYFVADSFSFGVERDLTELPDPANPGGLDTGAGESQQFRVRNSMDQGAPVVTQLLFSGNQLRLTFETVSSPGTLTLVSEFATLQPAVFTDVSVVQDSESQSFELSFALLYSAAYNSTLPVFSEILTGDFAAVPEPRGVWLLVGTLAALYFTRADGRPGERLLAWLRSNFCQIKTPRITVTEPRSSDRG